MSKEIIEKVIKANSVDEVVYYLLEEGVECSTDGVKELYDRYHNGEISKEELEKTELGSQCKGGKTYSSDSPYYLITTAANKCPAYEGTYQYCANCDHCNHLWEQGVVRYCKARTIDNDPYR